MSGLDELHQAALSNFAARTYARRQQLLVWVCPHGTCRIYVESAHSVGSLGRDSEGLEGSKPKRSTRPRKGPSGPAGKA